ncbi:tetratricopeptide repeat protein [Polyangium sp. y55x31]|uniref:tetratricopeptide repeat protein n=1 Tax=Polyangium sp. y55x31 TaxID=3042688 RepID=UPI00248219FA|nr:tetratricopeptide repeat protein [Polyangium sp. y55x31]MDI1481698.1 tetratricopeptide repeat protein [Polyangium sp. y55x31]
MNPLVPDFILYQDTRGRTDGNFAAAALFIDIPGFTNLTEKLFPHGREGAEILAGTLRFYFDPLIGAVHELGGIIVGFAGDAFTAVFPHSTGRNVAEHALAAALKMRQFFLNRAVRATRFGTFPFSYKVGLSWGALEWGIVRTSPERAYCYFRGPAIDKCASIEHHAEKGDILMDLAFQQRIPGRAVTPVAEGVLKLADVSDMPLPPVPRVRPQGDGAHFVPPGIRDMPPQGEFRHVTSVFLSFDQIPSFEELIKLVDVEASRYGGTFTGVDSGDKGINCLIHFGAPITHENDTERALDFALGIRKNAPKGMQIRAGITHGLRYAGFNGGTERQEFACLGPATNLAARLMMKAPWKELWCDGEVSVRAQGTHHFKPAGDHLFKGFEQPISVYTLDRKRVAVQREFLARGLVGREEELKALTTHLGPIFEGRNAGIVYVDGEPGLGKSFLVDTYRRRLEDNKKDRPILWIDARCDQTLRSSLNPFEYALKEYFAQSSATGREEKHVNFDDALDHLIDRLPDSEAALKRELEKARSVFAAMIGIRWDGSVYERMDPKLRFAGTLSALSLWLRAESLLQPVIFHLEDAHWADGDSLEAISHVAQAVKDCPVAVLCTCRHNDDGTPFRIELEGNVPQHAVPLGPLSREKLRELAEGLMGGPVSEVLAMFLSENANGNPFFAQEIMTYWLEANQLAGKKKEKEDTGVSTPSIFLLPNDVNSLLIARLDRLEPKVKRVVQAAATLGREFDLRILSRMMDDDPLLPELVRVGEEQCIWSPILAHGGYAQASGATPPNPQSKGRYRFSNVLLRNAAYEMQSRARLQELHRRAAEAIEIVHEDDLTGQLTALGRHWQRAGQPKRARWYFLAGARKAAERYAHGEAKRLYRAYFKLTTEPTLESVVVRYEFGRDVLELQGRHEEAMQEHVRVLDEAQKLGDRASEALGLLGLGRVNWATGRIESARAFYEQALTTAREAQSLWNEGLALKSLAVLHKEQGRFELARTFFEQALDIARKVGNRRDEGKILGDLASLHHQQGHVNEAVALQEQAQAIARELG